MKYIVAVSGGVDSVALLDMMSQTPGNELIVAHFDHGIRAESSDDAAFVKTLAERYGHRFELRREELGPQASEALARERRYAFLQELVEKYQAPLVTAHHLDDLVETVAINLTRGTGWRGLAVFDSPVVRPLVDTSKESLVRFATERQLEWHEDSTNQSLQYLRNRLRQRAASLPADHKRQLRALHAHQRALRQEIEAEAKRLIGDGPHYDRHLLTLMPVPAALECLYQVTRGALTRPQLARLLHAIKTYAAGRRYEAGNGVIVDFSTRYFTPKLIKL
ncbi:MAG TPA: tRNA lysidine(34) synthetase TilS [Dongiaceae bacterium]|nr:tRNA lysidine(34) synthetase TilS [Dongiaceae bacterium]